MAFIKTVLRLASPSNYLIAKKLNPCLCERHLIKNNPNLDRSNLAVLTAVNTMNEYLKLKEDYATLLGSIKRERG